MPTTPALGPDGGSEAPNTPKPTLGQLVSAYSILPTLATWLSTVDLFHLALANRAFHSHILGSPNVFAVLRRRCLCDGRGLALRQAYKPPYRKLKQTGGPSNNQSWYPDEEIEVRVFNAKCDEAGALPCLRCGINVCEECRYYPRASPVESDRRPHLREWGSHVFKNILCLCDGCDARTEAEVAGQFLNELCDCDSYRRWICTRCRRQEDVDYYEYKEKRMLMEWDLDNSWDSEVPYPPSKMMQDHAFDCVIWCQCGAVVPEDQRPRCIWCKRRHLPEDRWTREYEEVGMWLPFFEEDPNYPNWVTGTNEYPSPYPRLGYSRPGDDVDSS
ncbi:hypothetical protein CH35J_008791 [Colletotrichum higginsianum]|uniref:F-box domain-containing protein n=1 Tax=Colletotrichum higginsianum TaxID=80884 RepID=A0A4T0VSI1_9PEZI|nr:hypothetical protein CH35J_008791 [Colletotrichum higginsianum]